MQGRIYYLFTLFKWWLHDSLIGKKLYRKSSHRAEKVEQEKTALWEIRPMRGIEKFYKYFEIRGWRP